MFVSLVALVIALGGAGYSATGGNFILGRANSASTQTRLVTPRAGPAMRVDNTSTAPGATGMAIITSAARPPLFVTSSKKVTNRNADRLDGIDSENFTNRRVVRFILAPGGVSAPISVPANRPVLVIGATLTSGHGGVGQVTLVRVPDENLTWVSLDSAFGVVESGKSSTPGDSIVTVDARVFIEVNDANSIRISNLNSDERAGILTLMW
jgi:hypothetical protein